jgi:hypothetical protein
MSRLIAFAREHPSYSWRDLIEFSTPDEIRHLSGALLFEAVYRDSGWSGVRSLLQAGRSPDAIFAALPPRWGLTLENFEAWWRAEIHRHASAASPTP